MSQADMDRTNPVALRTKSNGASEVNSSRASLGTTFVAHLSLYREHDGPVIGFLTETRSRAGKLSSPKC